MLYALPRGILGDGWVYRFPWLYERIIERRFGRVRRQAFRHAIAEAAAGFSTKRLGVDVGCGTGLATIELAAACDWLTVIGVDVRERMLKRARRRAREQGLSDRCVFVRGDARMFGPQDLRRACPGGNGLADIVVSVFGFSVIPDWRNAFENVIRLLADDGYLVILDEFLPGVTVPDSSADASRPTWELVEKHVAKADTGWFGSVFVVTGHGKKPERTSDREP